MSSPGLYDMSGDKEAETVIVAVHGLGGDYLKTWECETNGWNWVRSSIEPRLQQEKGIKSRVLSFSYAAKLMSTESTENIRQVAKVLLEGLYVKMNEMKHKSLGIVFIAHSLGGLVVKKALNIASSIHNKRYEHLSSSVRGCLFLGVPHHGAGLASVAGWGSWLLGPFKRSSYVEDLRKDSPACQEISEDFVQTAKDLKIRTFYEDRRLNGLLVVQPYSAQMNQLSEVATMLQGSDHRTICKFRGDDDVRYGEVWAALVEIISFEKPTSSIDIVPDGLPGPDPSTYEANAGSGDGGYADYGDSTGGRITEASVSLEESLGGHGFGGSANGYHHAIAGGAEGGSACGKNARGGNARGGKATLAKYRPSHN
ncbi:uncharacterized protein AKAW2_11461A [Aspergillus luchuensis]|uniref:Uncharacterized protein n=1 Tax=Aspergillus kawachii TaxID=1069201 RepID=A0A7R7ZUX6_ASPKA|nr:uncharacterized protein AKAW2_11461A [Aspergillus luchuensis]BCR94416.1 hypothetical protein AKAW2_11461A [Aspergillus luchuensis]BCS07017.1 hypothetical protein ALUC_11398A [Aspergillus luchuensis]